MPITEEEFRRVQAANPGIEIEILQHDKLPDEVIARVPAPDVWTIFRNLQSEGKKIEASLYLWQSCTIFPAKSEVQKMYDAHPALGEVWSGEICEMAGLSAGARRKKF